MSELRRSPRLRNKTRPVYTPARRVNNFDSTPINDTPVNNASDKAAKNVPTPTKKTMSYDKGTNWVHGGIDDNIYFKALILVAPLLCQLLAYVTSKKMVSEPHLTNLVSSCYKDPKQCYWDIIGAASSGSPTHLWYQTLRFLGSFFGVALLLEKLLPGKIEHGPETLTGHVPAYVDNGFRHCLIYSALFFAGSNLGFGDLYDFGIIFDIFFPAVTILNIFGVVFCVFLYFKGLYFPSTDDNGTSGSFLRDYLWGTELYPRVFGLDIKRFINCRFSMTFWQLCGLSFAYRSFTIHGQLDYGLLLSAISQYLYLVKFFWWEMGYMRSIDIIVDRAGFEIQWGCLAYVPAVYTLHTRFLVLHPSNLSLTVASAIFVTGIVGVILNFAADNERDRFRAAKGQIKIWGKDPVYITAKYSIVDQKTGQKEQRTSLLLASGFWGVARHFQYFFELMAAWSWCLLSNPFVNGVIPLFYCVFLTALLIDRAKRDETKCQKKYGKYYDEYSKLVPYHIVPGIY